MGPLVISGFDKINKCLKNFPLENKLSQRASYDFLKVFFWGENILSNYFLSQQWQEFIFVGVT